MLHQIQNRDCHASNDENQKDIERLELIPADALRLKKQYQSKNDIKDWRNNHRNQDVFANLI
jgi:hypothetical protein